MQSIQRPMMALAVVLAMSLTSCALTATGDTTQPLVDNTAPVATTTPTTGPAEPTTTQATTTTTVVEQTSTTAPATTTTTTRVSNVAADGSGCTPGPGDLPDGRWFGLIDATTGDSIEFDLACWFSGDAADEAAAEDDEEAPNNGYYVRNENPALRTVDVAADADVVWYPNAGDPASEEIVGFADWTTGMTARGIELGVWIEVSDGEITSIQEQWVP